MISRVVKYYFQKFMGFFLDEPIILKSRIAGYSLVKSQSANVEISDKARYYAPYSFFKIKIGDFSYIAKNSNISNTEIGKFCSIGPNFCVGLGIHPINGISTSPMFYSSQKQNGYSLVDKSKVEETKKTIIGNDVFIGANVTILDGVNIADGAVIGAGAVVTKDLPPYSISVGVPAKVIKFRFENATIEKIQQSQWWDNFDNLKKVEEFFFDIDSFLNLK